MSLQVELCEHLAQDCLQAAERTKDPRSREVLVRHAVQWTQDALAALKQSRAAGARARELLTLIHARLVKIEPLTRRDGRAIPVAAHSAPSLGSAALRQHLFLAVG